MTWPARYLCHRLRNAVLVGVLCVGALAQASEQCPPQAPQPTRELMVQARAHAVDRGFLWRISRDGRDSFLYGTLHAGRPEWLALGPKLEQALHRTGALALEIDPGDMQVRQQLRDITHRPAFALTEPLQKALFKAWQAACLDAADLQTGPFEWHALRLAVTQAQRFGLFAEFGAEVALLMRNMHTERPVIGLETVDLQLDAFLARSPAEAQRMVGDLLEEHARPDSTVLMQRLAHAWAQSDWDEMTRYPEWCQCMRTEQERAYFDRMVVRRNAPMADAVERHHADQSVLAAVGALHMVGDQGLPALMRAKGFVVTRVF